MVVVLPCGLKRRGVVGPCFTKDELICYYYAIKSLFAFDDEKIDVFNLSREELWDRISEIMSKHIHDQSAAFWLLNSKVRQSIVNTCPLLSQTLLLQALLPVFRGDVKSQWLPASNLVEVMVQRAPHDLYFQGVMSADLRDATKAKHAAPYSITDVRKRIDTSKKWAMIMNLAPRNRPGEHWVALYKDKRGVIEYYDSLGEKINKRRVCGATIVSIKGDNELYEIRRPHQTDDHMCGMYACYYILARAHGIPSAAFKKNVVTHHEIKAFREDSIASNVN